MQPLTLTVTTRLPVSAEQMWEALQHVAALQRVAAPILVFKPMPGHPLPETWEVGPVYPLQLFLFGCLPLGRHQIQISAIDPQRMEIVSRETGCLARTWNHTIRITPISPTHIQYTDTLQITAGPLTPAIWLFAHLFYRHRQRQWANWQCRPPTR